MDAGETQPRLGRRQSGRGLRAANPLVRGDGVAVQVADTLHFVRLSIELDLVRLHHLLHRRPDFVEAGIDARLFDPRVGRRLDGLVSGGARRRVSG